MSPVSSGTNTPMSRASRSQRRRTRVSVMAYGMAIAMATSGASTAIVSDRASTVWNCGSATSPLYWVSESGPCTARKLS